MHREATLNAAVTTFALVGSLVPPNPVRALLAVPALLLVPGYSWVRALQRRTDWTTGGAQALAYGVALSFVGLSVGGVLLSALSIPLTAVSWSLLALTLTAAALVFALVAPLAKPDTTPGPAEHIAPRRIDRGTLAGGVLAGVAVAAIVVWAGVVTLRSDAVNRKPMTELSLRPTTGAAFAAAVRNREGRTLAYSLHFRTAAGEVARFDRTLAPGTLWVQPVNLENVLYRGAGVQAVLFRADHAAFPYREVHIARDPSAPTVCGHSSRTAALASCTARGWLLTIAGPGLRLTLPGARVRLLSTRRSSKALIVALRVSNTRQRPRRVSSRAPFYLSGPGPRPLEHRAYGRLIGGPAVLGGKESTTYRFAFPLRQHTRSELAAGRVDVGVVPDDARPRRHIGVIRLPLTDGPVVAREPAPRACASVTTQVGRVVCTTHSNVLTLVAEGQALVLPGVEARVLGSAVVRDILTVRLRLRNTSNRSRRVVGPGPFYLPIGGGRARGITTGGTPILAPRETAFFRVRFGPNPEIGEAVAQGERLELGVTPLAPSEGPRVGGVRLTPTHP